MPPSRRRTQEARIRKKAKTRAKQLAKAKEYDAQTRAIISGRDINPVPKSYESMRQIQPDSSYQLTLVDREGKIDVKTFGQVMPPSYIVAANQAVDEYIDVKKLRPYFNHRNGEGFMSFQFGLWKRQNNPLKLSCDLRRPHHRTQEKLTRQLLESLAPLFEYLRGLFRHHFPDVFQRYCKVRIDPCPGDDELDTPWFQTRPFWPWCCMTLTSCEPEQGQLKFHPDKSEDPMGLATIVVFGHHTDGGEVVLAKHQTVISCPVGTVYMIRGIEVHAVNKCVGGRRYSLVLFTDKHILELGN